MFYREVVVLMVERGDDVKPIGGDGGREEGREERGRIGGEGADEDDVDGNGDLEREEGGDEG